MELKPGGAGIIGQRCQPGRTPGLGRTGAKSSRTQNCPTAAEGSLALRWQWPGAVMAGPRELARQLQDPEVEEVAQGLQNLGPESTSLFFFSFLFGHPMAYAVPGPGIRTELQLQPTPQLQQRWILNPLCRARDRICVPAQQRGCQSHWATARTPRNLVRTQCQALGCGNTGTERYQQTSSGCVPQSQVGCMGNSPKPAEISRSLETMTAERILLGGREDPCFPPHPRGSCILAGRAGTGPEGLLTPGTWSGSS